jgi:alpha-beta hydrolase superfamily lysophospholipase
VVTLGPTKPITIKGWWSGSGVGPKFKPQHHQKKKKKGEKECCISHSKSLVQNYIKYPQCELFLKY